MNGLIFRLLDRVSILRPYQAETIHRRIEQPLGEPAKRIAVSPAQRSLAVNGLGLQRAIPAIDVSDLPVGQLLLDAHAPAGYPPPARLKRSEQ